jgi:hypothetical protein
VRVACGVVAALALAGCGGHKPSAYATANAALLGRAPVYPGASAPKTSASTEGDVEFAARDWTLPTRARPATVVDWTIRRLQAAGWQVTGKSFNTIRATRGTASFSIGVRGRTLEVIANSRGA